MIKARLFISFVFILLMTRLPGQGLFEESLNASETGDVLDLNGFVRSLAYAGRYDEKEVYMKSFYSQFGLIAEVNAGKYGKGYGEMRYRYGSSYNKRISEFEIREAYAEVYWGPVEIKAGKQVFSYGATSFINPSNQFAPLNPTYRSPDPDDLRIGVWAISSSFNITAGSSLKINWFPQYTPSVLLTEPFAFPEYVNFEPDAIPGLEIREHNFGVKYDMRSRFFKIGLFN